MNNLTINNEAATALDIKQLKEGRKEIANKLQAVADAVKAITGKLPDKSVVIDLVKDQNDTDLRLGVWSLYHRSLNINIPLQHIRTNSIETAPDEVRNLFHLARQAESCSDDPGQYFQKSTKTWKAVPVSEEEMNMIAQRNQQKFRSNEDKDAYEYLNWHAYFLNRSQIVKKKSMTPGKADSLFPHLTAFLEAIRRDKPEMPGPNQYYYEYKVRSSYFFEKGNDYRALDEVVRGDNRIIPVQKVQFSKHGVERV